MTDETTAETAVRTTRGHENRHPSYETRHPNWTRVEGVAGLAALLTSFIWFLGMPTGMAVGVGFGTVLLLDYVRALLFGASRSGAHDFEEAEPARR